MTFMQHAKWIYAAASSGAVISLFSYLQSDKHCVQNSWTTNFEPSVKWDVNWDKRELSSLVKPPKNENDPNEQNIINEKKEKLKPTAIRNLILIRHGQYNTKAENDTDAKLTSLGQEQANFVGLRLKELNFNYTKLVHSTMTRATETASFILKHFPDLPVETDDMLREGCPITPEPPSCVWRPEEKKFFKDGPRIEAAFRKYFHRADASQKNDSYEIIVCHANVIRYFFCRVMQFPPEGWLRLSLFHCSITLVKIYPSGIALVYTLGDSGFIPAASLSV